MLDALIAASIAFSSAAKAATTQADVTAAIAAIKRDMCIAEFWGVVGAPSPPSVFYAFIRTEGDTSYAWLEGLDHSAGKDRIASFYTIKRRNGKSAVGRYDSYNTVAMQQDPNYQQSWQRVFGLDWQTSTYNRDFQVGELRVPFECWTELEPETPLKRRMVDVIQKSAANFFTLAKRGGYTFPERPTIVIADFDTDFLNTLLLVLETGAMFNVTLHEPGDPFGDSFLERGEYQIADVSQRAMRSTTPR